MARQYLIIIIDREKMLPPLSHLEIVSQSFFVIASDRRERGNLYAFNAL